MPRTTARTPAHTEGHGLKPLATSLGRRRASQASEVADGRGHLSPPAATNAWLAGIAPLSTRCIRRPMLWQMLRHDTVFIIHVPWSAIVVFGRIHWHGGWRLRRPARCLVVVQ